MLDKYKSLMAKLLRHLRHLPRIVAVLGVIIAYGELKDWFIDSDRLHVYKALTSRQKLTLADKGAKVTIIEMLGRVATDMGLLARALLMERMKKKGIKIFTKKRVKEINPGGLTLEDDGHIENIDHVDTIVLAVGYRSDRDLQKIIEEKGIPFYRIGDCSEPRDMMEAIHEGFLRACEL